MNAILMFVLGFFLMLITIAFFKVGATFLTQIGIKKKKKITKTFARLFLIEGFMSVIVGFFATKNLALLMVIIVLLTSFIFSTTITRRLKN